MDVATGNDANTTDGEKDTAGADGVTVTAVTAVTGVAAGTVGQATAGLYGVLTLNADGSYSYVRNANAPGDVSDVFTYTITDGDGDTDTAKLTITLDNSTPTITDLTPKANGGDVTVKEEALADGSNPTSTEESATGTFKVTSVDGIKSLTVHGEAVITNDVFTAKTITTPLGNELKITGYDAATGVVTYTYTLQDNETHPTANGKNDLFEDFAVVLTDMDDDPASSTLTVKIVDDVPTAVDDVDSVAAGQTGPATGNVLTGVDVATGNDANTTDGEKDTAGADGVTVTAVTAVTGVAAGTVGQATAGLYGVLTLNADGSYYSYVRNANAPGDVSDVFTYTITDGDGDTDTAKLTITLDNSTPTITDLTPKANGGDVTVKEEALADGSNPTSTEESATGTFKVTSVDGIKSLTVHGEAVITNDVFTAKTITTPLGNELKITGYDAATGVVTYTYTLQDNETHPTANGKNDLFEDFAVVLTDMDDDPASSTLTVKIVDDVPTAVDDVDSVAAGQTGPATGNVLTGVDVATGNDANTTDGEKDTAGADGVTVTAVTAVTGVAAGTVGQATAGLYGVLTLNADGSYSYVRNANAPGDVSDVFTYTITDGDGDTDTAKLTITLDNSTPTITDLTPKANGGDVTVKEEALADGSNPTSTEESATGTFKVTSVDGIKSLTVHGEAVITNDVFTAKTITTPLGNELKITGYDAATGVVTYTYTLQDNETHPTANGKNDLFEDFAVVLTDMDDDPASSTLTVKIVDDVPTAVDDVDSVAAGQTGPATGNVLTGVDVATGNDANTTDGEKDTAGADGVTVTAVTAVTGVAAGTVGQATAGLYGVLTLNADGSYSYVRNANAPGDVSDVFTYTITDGDGDTDTAKLTITLDNSTPTITDLTPKANGGDVTVKEEALADGSNPTSTEESATGTFKVTSVDGIKSLTVHGEAVITNDVFTAKTITTPLGNELKITGYDAATGVVTYTYTLQDNETHPTAKWQERSVRGLCGGADGHG
ncbi:Ig-like domain-containing protein [Brachymonas sp. G13]|uniref:Ig-like domain-containing protein n=1 Tax=Brachymonas wangyanguii TaxID=3130163 RepID=UPI00386FE1EF